MNIYNSNKFPYSVSLCQGMTTKKLEAEMKENFRKWKNRIKTLKERIDAKQQAPSDLQAAMPGVGTVAVAG